jgi:TonB-dependent Receptor Plug Domain
MRNRSIISLMALASIGMVGCASSPSSSTAGAQQSAQSSAPRRGSRDRITSDELATVDAQNALQAIQRLRPSFLQTRGGASSSLSQGAQDVVVYVDQTRMGGPSTLAQIPITDVKEIQYLSASDATQRYGTGHSAGAIVVIRK